MLTSFISGIHISRIIEAKLRHISVDDAVKITKADSLGNY
jgi:hypothetical protein